MFVDTSNEVIKEMKNAGRRACRKVAKEISNEAISNLPNNRGVIRKSLKYGAQVSTHTGQPTGKVGYKNKKQLRKSNIKVNGHLFIMNPSWIEFGTKPHTINKSKSKKILANKSANKMFGRTIKHPGTNPLKVVQKAAQKVSPNAMKIAAEEYKILSEHNETLKNMMDDGNDEI